MAWDTVLRFATEKRLPHEFFSDFVRIASDEARHFLLLCERLKDYNLAYGMVTVDQQHVDPIGFI